MNDQVEEDDAIDSDFSDFALPPDVTEVLAPSPLEFYPWHKPRKQYVREHQWLRHARGTISKMLEEGGKLEKGSTINYLTLPGPDMIDVKMMAELCRNLGVLLKYTGFCAVNEDEAVRLRRNTSQFHIQWRESVQAGSDVHALRLEEITVKGSEARTLMERGGPYTIINIDACEPLAKGNVDGTSRLIDAIRRILDFQLGNARGPWLFYLTTPVESQTIDDNALNALKNEIRQNAEQSADFLDALSRFFDSEENLEGYLARTSASDGHDLCKIFSLGLAKWFVHMAEQANFKAVQMQSFCYSMLRRSPTHPNMISTCYLFLPTPIPLVDRSGLTADSIREETTPPKSTHITALERSVNIRDLDVFLEGEPDENRIMISKMKELLASVGYNVEDPERGYDAWLAAEAEEISQPYEDRGSLLMRLT